MTIYEQIIERWKYDQQTGEDMAWMIDTVDELLEVLELLLSNPSDNYVDATDTSDGYFLTPLQIARRKAQAAIAKAQGKEVEQ